MRRGCQVTVAGRGGGGYSKPPPGPLTHASGNRMRLHSLDTNGSGIKDRFGSPRERSPSLGSTMPLSPSHLNAREKSPNPTSQDFQDCSMCLSAYIQSLNTVCGTACRLAQCLAQVGTDNGSNETSGTGTPFHQVLRDAAEMWEGIARAVGVTSTGVKNQTLVLLQEAQANQGVEFSDSSRKLEVAKVMRTVLSTFLNLQYQFSLVVVERFSGMLQHLKDDTPGGLNGVYGIPNNEGGHRPSPSPSVSPHHPSPSPPQTQMSSQYSHLPAQQILQQQQQMLQQQQQHQLALQQQALLQHIMHLNSIKNSSHNEVSSLTDESGSRHSSGGSSSALQAPVPPMWSNVGGSLAPHSSQNTSNTLSPGLCGMAGEGIEALSRRWSMGASTSCEEGYPPEKLSALSPFNLFTTRRWSVPETSEFDPTCQGIFGFQPFYGLDHVGGGGIPPLGGARSPQNRSFHKGNSSTSSHLFSRENSCTRSPSHSRSVTPDSSRRVSSVSNEELQDVIDLLSMPIALDGYRNETTPLKPMGGAKSAFFSPKENSPYQRILENNQESKRIPSSASSSSSSSNSHVSHDNSNVSCSSNGSKSQGWGENPTEESSTSLSMSSKPQPNKKDILKRASSQISTSLWPPTDNVPGVTLTECVGESDKQGLPWAGERQADEDASHPDCLSRESITRSSWPVTSYSSSRIMDDRVSGSPIRSSQESWPPSRPNASTFRRHSTDAPYLLQQEILPSLSNRTRSFENIAMKGNEVNIETSSSQLQGLFPSMSQYPLFTSMS